MRAARLALVPLVLLIGCGQGSPSPSPTPMTHQMTVAFALHSTDSVEGTANNCYGTGGYGDFKIGMQATVKDASGQVVAFGTLNQSRMTDVGVCTLVGTIDNVPEMPIYTIDSGRRGSINYSRADMEAAQWVVKLTLGQ